MSDSAGFETDERRRGIRKSLIEKALQEAKHLERFLESRSKSLETATPADVEDYLEERTMTTVAILDVHGIGRLFNDVGKAEMAEATRHLRLRFTGPFKLSGFLDVDSSHIAALAEAGIRTNNQLLRRAVTTEARRQLACEVGIPEHAMEKLARLSDLARMRGVRGIRAKLYYDMGIQTVKQMAEWTPEDLVEAANAYIEHSDFEGIATFPKEAQFTVDLANRLPSIADFS